MPKTKIFLNGSSYSATNYGGINIEGKDDLAKIIFTDKEKNKTNAEFQIYDLFRLKFSPTYRRASQDEKYETYIHDWYTRRTGRSIIKYAGSDQQAFIFTTDGKVDRDLSRLYQSPEFNSVDYFKEIRFCDFLENHQMTMTRLRAIPGMDESRIQLLMNHLEGFEKLLRYNLTFEQIGSFNIKRLQQMISEPKAIEELISKGITIEQLSQVDPAKLNHYFENAYFHLDKALTIVTIQQILGINHIPLDISKIKLPKDDGWKSLGGSGYGSFGAYSFEDKNNHITVTYKKNNSHYQLAHGKAQEKSVKIFEDSVKNATPEVIVRAWYKVAESKNENGQTISILYSPALKYAVHSTIDASFPVEDFMKDIYSLAFVEVPYFHEKDFAKKVKIPLDVFKKMEGMTQGKLELLEKYSSQMQSLLWKGADIPDFALVDEKRLAYILQSGNYGHALEFVDIKELFGLRENMKPEVVAEEKVAEEKVAVENKPDKLLSLSPDQIFFSPAPKVVPKPEPLLQEEKGEIKINNSSYLRKDDNLSRSSESKCVMM